MPYVLNIDKDPELRPKLDKIVKHMIDSGVVANGDLNYILFALCKRSVKPSYNNYKNFIGELNECAAEIRRRFLSPYEEKAILRNGDVE